MRAASLLVLAACGVPPLVPIDGAGELGMNDVSLLLPLPADRAQPTLASIDGVVPENLVASLVFANRIAPKNGLPVAYGDFQIVAVRFDVCDRAGAGPCPDDADGRLRLVLQPLYAGPDGTTFAHDIALHAFYPIPAAELPGVVGELRALAALQGIDPAAPLAVNAGASSQDYVARLRALVLAYARSDRLLKLTAIGQDAESAAFAWIFGGFEQRDGAFAAIAIPNLGTRTRQHVLAAGGDAVYLVEPGVDSPPGFALTLDSTRFAAASPDDQRFALETLATIENPELREAGELQCVTCHVATLLTTRRAAAAGIDPQTLGARYRADVDLAVDSITSTDPRSVRAFGWGGNHPAISQRVANDSAHVLVDIARRFQAARRFPGRWRHTGGHADRCAGKSRPRSDGPHRWCQRGVLGRREPDAVPHRQQRRHAARVHRRRRHPDRR